MRVLVISLLLLALTNSASVAQTKVGQGYDYSLRVLSPRSAGMGGCTINLVDPQSAMGNPGTLGILHLNRFASISFPSSTDWLSGYDDLVIKNHGFSVGASATSLWNRRTSLGNVSVGFAYHKTHYDYAPLYTTTYESSQGYGWIDRDDWTHAYSVGIGIEQHARLGIGYTYREIKNHWFSNTWTNPSCHERVSVSGHTSDIGLVLEVPLSEILLEGPPDDSRLYPDVGISGAYVAENVGGISGQSVIPPSPESDCGDFNLEVDGTSKYGFSLWGAAFRDFFRVASVRVCLQAEVDNSKKRFGVEMGVLSTINLRLGRIEKGGTGRAARGTNGIGVNLGGLLRALSYAGVIETENRFLRHIMDDLDISFDYSSRRVELPFGYSGKREYWKFSLAI